MSDKFQSISSGLGILKNYYQGPIKDQFNEEFTIMRAAEKIKQGWSGVQVNRPLRLRRNQGIGAIADGGNLPSIGRQTTAQAVISAKYNYLRFGVTGPMIAASQSDVGSFVRSAAFELEMGYKDLKSDVNRQLGWDGTGTLALVNTSSVASTSLVIKGRESTEAALKFVDVDLQFDVISGSTVIASGVTVNSISGAPTDSTATLTLSQAITTTAGDKLVRSGSNNNEIQGLLYALDGATSTIYSIDRSVYTQYHGNVINLASGQLTLDKMQQGYNECLRRGNGKISGIYCDYDSLRMYQKLLTPDKRYVNSKEGDGSFGKKGEFYLEFMGTAVVADKDAPTRFFFLAEDVLKLYVLKELEFASEQGEMYIAQVSQDAYEVRLRYFANLFNEQPAACSVLKSYISP